MEDRNLPSSRTVEVNTAGAVIVDDSSSDSDEEYQANGSGSSNPITNGANGDSDSRDIYLPRYTEQKVSHCALDIGGSLIKIVYFSRAKGKQRESSSSSSNGWDAVTSPRQPRTPATHSRPASPGLNGRATPVPNGVLGPESLVSAANISSYFDANHQASSSSSSSSSNLRAKSASASAKPRTGSKAQRSASFTAPIPGGWLNFAKFETGDIESCIAYLNQLIETSSASHNISTSEFKARHVKIMATGGGAHLFYDKLSHDLGVEVRKEEEMECLIAGLTFFMEIPNEVFWYSDQLVHASHDPATCSQSPILPASQTLNPPPQQSLAPEELPRPSPNPPQYALVFDDRPAPHFPCLLVNIGSGVSIIKVDDYGKYERISGTSLGGGTLWGLLSLLTGAETFDEMLALSEKGDNANVDMLVGDIYGSDYSKIGLKSSTIASSFGKVFKKDNRGKKFKPEDIAKSLLYAVSNNIGQIAYMNAEKHNLDRIYFGGCFIRGHAATISTLSYAIRFWSKGTKKALFLRHEGYLGAIGAWLRTIEEEQQENRQ